MTETVVRLTATTEDGQVVYVLANAKGELKLEEPIAPPEFDGQLDGDLDVTGNVTADGTAKFTGNVTVGSGGNKVEIQGGMDAGYIEIDSLVSNSNSRLFQASSKYGVSGDNPEPKITFDATGSAEFKGSITATSSSTFAESGTFLNDDKPAIRLDTYSTFASLAVKNPSSYTDAAFQVLSDGYGVRNIKALIGADGSITAAGNKAGFTAEGHLFCTTTRGDLVVLENTSGGFGAWVEYTPPSMRDQVQEKLDEWAEKDKKPVIKPIQD